MIVGRISHQVRRLFSFLNFSDRFEKKPARGDDRKNGAGDGDRIRDVQLGNFVSNLLPSSVSVTTYPEFSALTKWQTCTQSDFFRFPSP
jgi:hypothetical protein